MGFYGNITNTSRTTFQFDKIYPNRYSMEKNTNTDEVFIGRYVLIEYDSTGTTDDLPRVYFGPDNNGYLYTDSTLQHPVLYTEDLANISTSTGYITARVANTVAGATYKYYVANPVAVGDPLIFELDNSSIYSHNFDIDENYAAETGVSIGRGWDSTVWQKVFIDGQQKYINIAELNTVVPTFGITVDAPSDNPAAPHFGERSTNVYYDLHVSAPWGFRVKEANGSINNRWSNASINNYIYYDNNNQQFLTKTVNGDIYFNREAFDPQLNAENIKKHSPNITTNEISISNGYTDRAYNNHNTANPIDTSRQEDVKELSIHLPAIGNMISDVWDIVYGINRDSTTGDADNGSLIGRLNSFSAIPANQIPVKRASDGTLVGTKINGDTHYAVNGPAVLDNYSSPGFASDDAWIYTKIESNNISNDNNNNGIQIHHTFHAQADTTTTSNKNIANGTGINAGQGDTLKLYTPIVDAMGHVVGKSTETVTLPYGYKTIAVTNSTVSTSYTDPENAVANNIVADNTQDIFSIEAGNKWIRFATDATNDKLTIAHETHTMDTVAASDSDINSNGDTITIQDIAFDAAGHMTANKNHTYTLPYGYKQFTVAAASTAITNPAVAAYDIIASNTQDIMTIAPSNKWIRLHGADDNIKIGHQVNTFESGSPNTKYGLSSDETIATLDVDNTFEVPAIKADEAGHVTFLETHTVTLPENFSKITITTSNATANSLAGLTGDIEPDSLIDTLTLAEGNQWINIEADSTNDKIIFKHYVKLVTPTTSTASLSNTASQTVTFPVPTYSFDNAGHITAQDTKTYTMPFGYGNITGDNNGVTSSASATYDTFSITGDTWITTSVSTDAVALAHSAPHNTAHTSISNETPNFGSTFTITDWDFDTKGHKANSGTHTVTIPQGSLTDATASGNDVITQLAFVPSTGALSTTRTNITTLKLADYNNTALSGQQTITSTDTLGQALQKTQTNIDLLEAALAQEISDRNDAIDNAVNALVDGAPAALDTLKEIADWIDEEPTGAAAMANRIGSLETAVNLINGTSSQNGSIAYAIDQEVTNRNNAITTAITNANLSQYLTQTDAASTYLDTSTTFSSNIIDSNNNAIIDNMSIQDVIDYIAGLQNAIAALNDRVTYLETFHPAPTPSEPEEPNPDEPGVKPEPEGE